MNSRACLFCVIYIKVCGFIYYKISSYSKRYVEKKKHSNGQTTAIIRMELTILEKTWTRMHFGFFFFFSSTNKRRSHNPTNPTSIVDQILELLKKKKKASLGCKTVSG